jgi:hypothetical protein
MAAPLSAFYSVNWTPFNFLSEPDLFLFPKYDIWYMERKEA